MRLRCILSKRELFFGFVFPTPLDVVPPTLLSPGTAVGLIFWELRLKFSLFPLTVFAFVFAFPFYLARFCSSSAFPAGISTPAAANPMHAPDSLEKVSPAARPPPPFFFENRVHVERNDPSPPCPPFKKGSGFFSRFSPTQEIFPKRQVIPGTNSNRPSLP